MKKIIVVLITCLTLISCKNFNVTSSSFNSEKEIDIIFVSNNSSSLKEEYIKNTPNVTVVGCGDIDANNELDYSAVGKDEFKDGTASFYNHTKSVNFKYLACDLSYNGKTKDIFKKVDPYVIVDYDGIKVGYIGVTSPNIKNYLNSKSFMENDSMVVNFYDEEPEVLYDTVKEAIANVKEQGANYVILLSYLGTSDIDSPYSSYDVINNVSDIDVLIDGNSSSLIQNELVKDLDGKNVNLCAFDKTFMGHGLIKIEKENISIEFK